MHPTQHINSAIVASFGRMSALRRSQTLNLKDAAGSGCNNPARDAIHPEPAVDKFFVFSGAVVAGYCLVSGAANTWRQAAGNCASVMPWFGVGGSFGGSGWMIESLNQ